MAEMFPAIISFRMPPPPGLCNCPVEPQWQAGPVSGQNAPLSEHQQ
jgi:hypothetical protein